VGHTGKKGGVGNSGGPETPDDRPSRNASFNFNISEEGSGGGGQATEIPSVTVTAKKAKGLFKDKNNNMTSEQWISIEGMLDKIIPNCLGGNLYNALLGRVTKSGVNFSFAFTSDSTTSGFTPGTNGGFRISTLGNSGSLLHEMIHAYQYGGQSVDLWDTYAANREVEAYIAMYMFTGELNQDLPFAREIECLFDNYLTKNGTLQDPSMEIAFNAVFESTAKFIKKVYDAQMPDKPTHYDKNRTGKDSISSIRELTKNC